MRSVKPTKKKPRKLKAVPDGKCVKHHACNCVLERVAFLEWLINDIGRAVDTARRAYGVVTASEQVRTKGKEKR